jgi:hypothetical protein
MDASTQTDWNGEAADLHAQIRMLRAQLEATEVMLERAEAGGKGLSKGERQCLESIIRVVGDDMTRFFDAVVGDGDHKGKGDYKGKGDHKGKGDYKGGNRDWEELMARLSAMGLLDGDYIPKGKGGYKGKGDHKGDCKGDYKGDHKGKGDHIAEIDRLFEWYDGLR